LPCKYGPSIGEILIERNSGFGPQSPQLVPLFADSTSLSLIEDEQISLSDASNASAVSSFWKLHHSRSSLTSRVQVSLLQSPFRQNRLVPTPQFSNQNTDHNENDIFVAPATSPVVQTLYRSISAASVSIFRRANSDEGTLSRLRNNCTDEELLSQVDDVDNEHIGEELSQNTTSIFNRINYIRPYASPTPPYQSHPIPPPPLSGLSASYSTFSTVVPLPQVFPPRQSVSPYPSPSLLRTSIPVEKSSGSNTPMLYVMVPVFYPSFSTYSPIFCVLSNDISHILYIISCGNSYFFYHCYDKVCK
jgi:hypothetical protein